jgi:hypothetical protein
MDKKRKQRRCDGRHARNGREEDDRGTSGPKRFFIAGHLYVPFFFNDELIRFRN